MESNRSDALHILVVEDSSSARMNIVSTLESMNVVIHEADDGLSALAFLKQDDPPIDLVLSDLVMNAMDGDELCRLIRCELCRMDLPVIILSSHHDKETVLKLFKAGVNDYLFKPFMPEELVARITAHLEQKKLNTILKMNIEELTELNKMKNHFLAACSHDFRSPLQGILGFTELLMNDSSLAEHHHTMFKHIMEAGNQLYDLIESLLDFSLAGNKPEDITMIHLNIGDVIYSCVKNNSFSADDKKITIQVPPNKDLPFLKGNPNAMSRIFNNLISNAVKFTSPGGLIKIKYLHHKSENRLSISVTDNGVGIPDDLINRVFDRYSIASRQGTLGEKSTGLGLYITRQLVELHQGEISVKSKFNRGTCFTVTFPLE